MFDDLINASQHHNEMIECIINGDSDEMAKLSLEH